MVNNICCILIDKTEDLFISEFANVIKTLVGGNNKIVHVSEVEDDPQRRRPDITRAKKYLDWEPKVDLNVGLQKTVEYFRQELKRFKHSPRNKFIIDKHP